MADDAFMKPEKPDAIRDLMRMSIEQAKQAFDTFVTTSEKTWKSFETTSQSARQSLAALNGKIADITRSNAEANFALAMKLAGSKDINQAMELQSQHARQQMETFARQLEEMRDLAAKLIEDAKPAMSSAVKSAAASSPFSPSGEGAAPRSTSSFTPRGGPSSGSSW